MSIYYIVSIVFDWIKQYNNENQMPLVSPSFIHSHHEYAEISVYWATLFHINNIQCEKTLNTLFFSAVWLSYIHIHIVLQRNRKKTHLWTYLYRFKTMAQAFFFMKKYETEKNEYICFSILTSLSLSSPNFTHIILLFNKPLVITHAFCVLFFVIVCHVLYFNHLLSLLFNTSIFDQ